MVRSADQVRNGPTPISCPQSPGVPFAIGQTRHSGEPFFQRPFVEVMFLRALQHHDPARAVNHSGAIAVPVCDLSTESVLEGAAFQM